MAKISVEHVSVDFKQKKGSFKAVSDVSFAVEQGEIYGIVGLSGAGKSTLVRTLNLLQAPSAGSIKIDEQEITQLKGQDLRDLRQKIGMIFQHFNLIQNRTIAQNLAFSLKAGNYPAEKQKERIDELLRLVDLQEKKNDYPSSLSGGQKQRIGIARALANQPEILLCDEATSALDVETTEEILQLLQRINQDLGITIVFITHELDVGKRLFDRMGVMEAGTLIEEGSTYQIFSAPQQLVTRRFVSRNLSLSIPQEVKEHLTDGRLLELRYQGEHTLDPLISDMVQKWPISISIIHAKIEYIQQKAIGILCIYLTGEEEAMQQAQDEIKKHVYQLRTVEKGA